MSKIIRKSKKGKKSYPGVLSTQEVQEANILLEMIIKTIDDFQSELEKNEKQDDVTCRYKIGKLLNSLIEEGNIPESERLYLWNEIRDFTNSELNKTKDRSNKRGFYEYCSQIARYDKDLVDLFLWWQWEELLDRSLTLKDTRVIDWLSPKAKKMKRNDFRLFLVVLNSYLTKNDTTVFDDEEIKNKYNQLFEIVNYWNIFYNKYFESDRKKMSKARNIFLPKYRKKYCVMCLSLLQGSETMPSSNEYELIFKNLFIDIDTSGRFKK